MGVFFYPKLSCFWQIILFQRKCVNLGILKGWFICFSNVMRYQFLIEVYEGFKCRFHWVPTKKVFLRKFWRKKSDISHFKGSVREKWKGYRLNAIKKRFWSLLFLLLSVASTEERMCPYKFRKMQHSTRIVKKIYLISNKSFRYYKQ